MWYIKGLAENDNYGNPHYPARDGDLALPDALIDAYLETRGFAVLTADDGEVTAVEKNEAAYEAYMAEHPDTPAPPTDMERLEAQVLFTALMTDTLIEEE